MSIRLSCKDNYLLGKTIKIDVNRSSDGSNGFCYEKREYTIVGIYPHYVMACYTSKKTGEVLRECFNIGDLVIMGLIESYKPMEIAREIYERRDHENWID